MSNVHRIDTNLTTVDVGRPSSSAGEEWESFKILFHDFAALPSALGIYTRSPEFKCNGHQWSIAIYPGGRTEASAGNLSLYLGLCSGSGDAMATFELSVLDKFQRKKKFTMQFMDGSFVSDGGSGWGWDNFCYRSYILNQSNNILDDNGTFAVIASIKRDSAAPFVPSNPMSRMITGMFLDEETADICFEVSTEVDSDDGDEVAPLPVTFHAHSQILQGCAPILASLFLFGSDGEEIATASINDVKPAIFRHLLHYVYGGSVEEGELNAHAKDIINAADKYSIVNLKLKAETAYVNSTKITMDNAMDNLLYADARNCAFLKEAVIDFLTENSEEATEKISFSDVPGHVMKDLLVAVSRREKGKQKERNQDENNFTTMRVSELRIKLAEIGLDVDGSREAMIEALQWRRRRDAADDSL
eukprot:scaffold14331_cov83-Skeletonema_dohrnii-CCMP3373.AAC.7